MFNLPHNIAPELRRVFTDIQAEMFRLARGGNVHTSQDPDIMYVINRIGDVERIINNGGGSGGDVEYLGDLENVVLNSPPTDQDVLTYQASTNTWINKKKAPLVYTPAGTVVSVASSELEAVWVANHAGDSTWTLPVGTAALAGRWIECHRVGAGSLTVAAGAANTIGATGTEIGSTVAGQASLIVLRLITLTRWAVIGVAGTWRTA